MGELELGGLCGENSYLVENSPPPTRAFGGKGAEGVKFLFRVFPWITE